MLRKILPRAAAVISLAGLACLTACSSKPAPAATAPSTASVLTAPPTVSKITAFSVSNENLNVDKVGLRDGLNRPDGNRDLAFNITIEGPFDAIFVVSCNAKGDPGYGLRSDTLVASEEIPAEIGGVIDTGKMTVGIGVMEGGKWINGESGSAHAGPGIHTLNLYVPNTATLQAGSFVRAYIKAPGGQLVAGPIAPY